MKCRRSALLSTPELSAFSGFRFPPEVILLSVRWYLRFGLSYRDLEELLSERGIDVDHVTLYRWMQRFTPLFIEAARPYRHTVRCRWFVDETYVKVAGRWRYVHRAVDQHGQVIDVLSQRDATSSYKLGEYVLAGSENPRNPGEAGRGRRGRRRRRGRRDPSPFWSEDHALRGPSGHFCARGESK